MRVRERDLAWLAGFLDGEACFIMARTPDTPAGYRVAVEVSNTHRGAIDLVAAAFKARGGRGNVREKVRKQTYHQQLYITTLSGSDAVWHLLDDLLPYLVVKQQQAGVQLAWLRGMIDGAQAHEQLRLLNKRGTQS